MGSGTPGRFERQVIKAYKMNSHTPKSTGNATTISMLKSL